MYCVQNTFLCNTEKVITAHLSLLCACIAADARPLGGIWLSGRAIKWPMLCVRVSMCVTSQMAGA